MHAVEHRRHARGALHGSRTSERPWRDVGQSVFIILLNYKYAKSELSLLRSLAFVKAISNYI